VFEVCSDETANPLQCLLNCEGVAAFAHMVHSHIVNASVLVHVLTLTASDLSCPPRSWRAAQQRGDLDRYSQRAHAPALTHANGGGTAAAAAAAAAHNRGADDYAGMPVKVLKRLMEQRSLDPSACIEKADLVTALRDADRATAAAQQPSSGDGGGGGPPSPLEPEPEPRLGLESEAQATASEEGGEGVLMSLELGTCGDDEPWHAAAMGAPALLVSRERPRLTMALIDALDSRVAEHDNLCFINVSSARSAWVVQAAGWCDSLHGR
jgi:hypothetical protein